MDKWAEQEVDESLEPPTIFLVIGILYIAAYLTLFGATIWMLVSFLLGLI